MRRTYNDSKGRFTWWSQRGEQSSNTADTMPTQLSQTRKKGTEGGDGEYDKGKAQRLRLQDGARVR